MKNDFCYFIYSQDPPTYTMKYSWFHKIGANWSTTTRASDFSMHYAVVRYTEYAPSIEEFIEKYPYTTIEQCNRAISYETFGDVGTGCHTFEMETLLFTNANYYNKFIIENHGNDGPFDVGVYIGVGVKKDGNTLYVRPFTNGWMYSGGATWRYLDFGLSVSSVTFQPKSNFQNNQHNILTNEV